MHDHKLDDSDSRAKTFLKRKGIYRSVHYFGE